MVGAVFTALYGGGSLGAYSRSLLLTVSHAWTYRRNCRFQDRGIVTAARDESALFGGAGDFSFLGVFLDCKGGRED